MQQTHWITEQRYQVMQMHEDVTMVQSACLFTLDTEAAEWSQLSLTQELHSHQS